MRRLWIIIAATGAAGCGSSIQTGQVGVKYAALHKFALQQQIRPEGFY